MRGSKATEQVQGTVERVTFHSEETGFCVLRTKVKGHRELVTVTGHLANIAAGEFIECEGDWVNDKKHGMQFSAQQLKTIRPTTLDGIEKYLGSGMIKGIGPHFAKKLVRAFGGDVFDIIENEPRRLLELDGIGRQRLRQVISGWKEQRAVRDIMIFLQANGVGTTRAVRIYKTYGDKAIATVQENPYRLALDIRGIGFHTADALAAELGIEKNSLQRAQAGVRHVLHELCQSGHCAVPLERLHAASQDLLDMPEDIIEQAIGCGIDGGYLVKDILDDEVCVYSAALYEAECRVAKLLRVLREGDLPWGDIDVQRLLPWVEKETGLELSESQSLAVQELMCSKLSVLTGGPGVGKTTIVRALLLMMQKKKLQIALAAPTGRAAKRLGETTGLAAKTIHRLLEFDPINYGFKHDEINPLTLDVLIIDESSMIDLSLLHSLLKAVPAHAAVIFVGDVDQLPSVGSGAVLSDMIASGVITTVRLVEIFRQAADSQIIVNAHRVNYGEMPLQTKDRDSDFFVIYEDTPERIQSTVVDLVAKRLPAYYQCDPISEIQVLTPMNRGGLGTVALNEALQKALNGHSEPTVSRYGTTYSPGDKVIQMSNNYDRDVFNGDIGVIESINTHDGMLDIAFDRESKVYETNELDELSLAYAISIHKSQGSEFPIIVIPLSTAHYNLLARNLLYTAITRGKKLVVLVGQKKAVAMAVKNNRSGERITGLAQRLRGLVG